MTGTDPSARSASDASTRPSLQNRRGRDATPAPTRSKPTELAITAGDIERFMALEQSIHAHLVRLARRGIHRALQGRVSEEDVVQDTVTSMLQAVMTGRRHLLDDPLQFECFFTTSLQNRIKELHGTHRRQCRSTERESPIELDSAAHALSTPSTRSPSRTLGREELADKLRREVEALRPIDRQIIVGRAVDEKTYPELGREVGLSSEATRKRYIRLWEHFAPRVATWLGLRSPKQRPDRADGA